MAGRGNGERDNALASRRVDEIHGWGLQCYVAGPMRGYPEFNYPAFNAAAAELRSRGWTVANPAETDSEVQEAAASAEVPLRIYMQQDLVDVCKSDVVFVLEGWEQSEGANLEVEVARRLGIPVRRYDDLSLVGVTPYSSTKASNPKDAIGSDKLPIHLWPQAATVLGCLGLLDGMLKYGRSNWREAGVRVTIYLDALDRHMKAYGEGENVDPDSGLPHLSHALACLAILVDAEAAGKLVDDRNFNGAGYRALVEELTPHVARLKEKHAGKSPHHYTIADQL